MPNPQLPTPVRRAGLLAVFAACYTYALILVGGIVRITGSGMGCGDHWPKCNGVWIPTFTLETFIEYLHRLLAAGVGLVLLALFVYAVRNRGVPGFHGRHGMLRPLGLAAVLLVVQSLLGAVTVWLELPTAVSAAHFMTAQVFIAILLVAAIRGGVLGGPDAHDAAGAPLQRPATDRAARTALVTAAFGFIVIALGAVTANLPGAPAACQGFPLCNGQLLPAGSNAATVHTHWTHRMLAFLFLLHVAAATFSTVRARVSRPVKTAATAVFVLVLVQVAVAAALVLSLLPQSLQVAHLAVGAAIWVGLVIWTALARREAVAVRAGGARIAEMRAAERLDPYAPAP